MTLLRQLALSMTGLLLLLFTCSLIMNIKDARSYLQTQLKSHAQDTATSLGVALASTQKGDVATIDSMVDAVFDRGFYRVIRFSDLSGNVLVNSEHPLNIEGVPEWFISIVALDIPEVSTEVNQGWVPFGVLYVASHPGDAYRTLWLKTRNESLLFSLWLFIAIIGLNIFLRVVLRPLKALEKQANAICDRRFEIQPQLPRTRDLRQVVEAMNRMAGKLEKLFNEKVILTEELRRQSLKDALTGILNERAFESQVTETLSEERGEVGGSFILIKIRGLDAHHSNKGRDAVDKLLIDVSSRLRGTIEHWPDAIVGRKTLSEFVIFLPACGIEENKRITEGCFRALASLHFFVSNEGEDKLHLASVTHIGHCQYHDLLEQAFVFLTDLELQGRNSWKVKEIGKAEELPYLSWTEGQWQEALQHVLVNEDIELFGQQAFDHQKKPLFCEVLARLRLDNELASAQAFLPMVDRFDLHTDFDRAVVNCLLLHMQRSTEQSYCINLFPRSIMDDGFFNWLCQLLWENPAISSRIIVETPERILLQDRELLDSRIRKLTTTGCHFSLDHFGVSSQSLNNLNTLDVSCIKLDSSFVRGIADNQGNQFYIRTLAMLASSRDITLLAQGIEDEVEWAKLNELGVQGGQGYYLAKPVKLID
ncbi:EAL domain-containing protein [Endozoicomonas sp. Mp262]|uniref:bifunctional diguanylate cyclase/phosphodiesterase n=1 Tax=Endozoicomonas sp. Mp262 TaxID=2919499 RepID=UPI0021DB59A2